MSPMPNFQIPKSPDRSWLYITCAVIIVHSLVIGWTVFFHEKINLKPEINSRLVVQTIALNSNPIPRNPIPKNRVTPTPIPSVPITPTPLERKTMWPPEPIVAPAPPSPEPVKPVETPKYIETPIPLEPEASTIEIIPAATPSPPIVTPPVITPLPTSLPPPKPLPPLRPNKTTPHVVKPTLKSPIKPIPPVTPIDVPAPPVKIVPQKAPDLKDSIKTTLEKANEEFKAKQHEISVKRKQEIEAIKAKKELDATKKKQEQDALKKKNEEAKKKEEEAKKKEAEHLAENQRQQKLVAEAQERIAKISGSRDKLASNTKNSTLYAIPHTITKLEIDSLSDVKGGNSLNRYELSYREELAGRLKLLLRLPEYGDVKVNLTLDRTGKVSKVAIVNADSVVNRKYIEKTLPELSFPAFGTNYASAAEYTFSITLSNEI